MKTTLVIIVAYVSLTGFLVADPKKKFPDLTKTFVTEKLISDSEVEDAHYVLYATNLNFEELKERIEKFLGMEWKERIQEPQPEAHDVDEEAINKALVIIEGHAIYENNDFPNVHIHLTLSKMTIDLEDKNFLASIIVMRNQAEEAAP
jgi:hypothetical protein